MLAQIYPPNLKAVRVEIKVASVRLPGFKYTVAVRGPCLFKLGKSCWNLGDSWSVCICPRFSGCFLARAIPPTQHHCSTLIVHGRVSRHLQTVALEKIGGVRTVQKVVRRGFAMAQLSKLRGYQRFTTVTPWLFGQRRFLQFSTQPPLIDWQFGLICYPTILFQFIFQFCL